MILALDTEFSRDRTYYPMLSLIQFKLHDQDIGVCDVILQDDNLNQLLKLLQDDSIVKVIHAAKQDIEAIYHKFGFIIQNVFDTQIAAKFLGFGDSISYVNLANQILGLSLKKEKNLQYSNWMKRPLLKEQIEYAKNDVKHLHGIYYHLIELFAKTENIMKNELFQLESNALLKNNQYEFNENSYFNKQKFRFIEPERYLKMKKLYALREQIASNKNIPRERVISSKDINDLILNDNLTILNKVLPYINTKVIQSILYS